MVFARRVSSHCAYCTDLRFAVNVHNTELTDVYVGRRELGQGCAGTP